jgi:hypothetical protein
VTASVFESIAQTPNTVQEIKKISDALASLISLSPLIAAKFNFAMGSDCYLTKRPFAPRAATVRLAHCRRSLRLHNRKNWLTP